MTDEMNKKPIIWTISGSDCSGGAGIAADIKTGHALDVEVCHLITANTVQNSHQLVSVNPVDVSILEEQWCVLEQDKFPQAIKIGLIANEAQVNWLCQRIALLNQKNSRIKVIYDPVGQASVGGNFSSLSSVVLKPLLAYIDILTPNLIEARSLTQCSSGRISLMAETLVDMGCNSVIIKGGHADENIDETMNAGELGYCTDYCLHTLVDDDSSKMSADKTIVYALRSTKINTDYSHGGGCSFASALASFCAHGHLVRDAFTLTKAFMQKGFQKQKDKTGYYGAFEQISYFESRPRESALFPRVETALVKRYRNLSAFPSLGIDRGGNDKLGLYPVIDSLEWLKRLLPLKLNIIQLRLKNKSYDELEKIIAEASLLCKNSTTRLFVNDYWELAIKYKVYGVHIGQEDLIDADLEKIQAAGLRLGISTHGCYEFLLSQQLKPSYLAIGAIYPTKTKDMTGQIQGLDNLVDTLKLATHIPVVAIGGINLERAEHVLNTGVDSIAVVTAITEAESPEAAVAQFQIQLTQEIKARN